MTDPTTPRPGSPRLRAFATALLWLIVLAVVAILLAGQRAPTETERSVAALLGLLLQLAIWLGAALALALVLWPTTLPWLRVRWSTLKDRMGADPGPYNEARGRLEHFESAPDHITVARYLLRQGQPVPAVQHLTRAVTAEPDNPQPRLMLAQALLKCRAIPQAAEQAAMTVRLDESYSFGEGVAVLGDALHRLHRDAEAEAALARHEELFGPQRHVDLLRARIAKDQGRTADARRFAKRAAARPAAGNPPLRPSDALDRARALVMGWGLGPSGKDDGGATTHDGGTSR